MNMMANRRFLSIGFLIKKIQEDARLNNGLMINNDRLIIENTKSPLRKYIKKRMTKKYMYQHGIWTLQMMREYILKKKCYGVDAEINHYFNNNRNCFPVIRAGAFGRAHLFDWAVAKLLMTGFRVFKEGQRLKRVVGQHRRKRR